MKMIVAADLEWGIGREGKLLAKLPGDLAYFRRKTEGQIVIMGRKTLESLPGGLPLKDRLTIVMTRDEDYRKEGVLPVHSIDELLETLEGLRGKEIFVAGGGDVYEGLLPYADRCYVTRIEAAFDSDVWFPDLDADPDFRLSARGEPVAENGITYRFCEYERVVDQR